MKDAFENQLLIHWERCSLHDLCGQLDGEWKHCAF
jgi:hypothetical protein